MASTSSQANGPILNNNTQMGAQDFIPRDYQVELFQRALVQNTIVYLPTGSGKTFIAALLIKEKADETTSSLSDGGKRTVFLVPTVALAMQQTDYLKRHTHLKVKAYYGSMGVDLWGKNKWQSEFEENQVLVMTAQIFVDILNHAFFSAEKVNLLVFDECHAAVKDSPMMQVLGKLETIRVDKRPKILGLTAALFRKKCKPSSVHNEIYQLSSSMKCSIRTPTDVDSVYRNSTNPCQMIIEYPAKVSYSVFSLNTLSDTIVAMVGGLVKEFVVRYEGKKVAGDKTDVLVKATKQILHLVEFFGIYGVYHTTKLYAKLLPRMIGRIRIPSVVDDFNRLLATFETVSNLCEVEFARFSHLDRLLLFVHPRVLRLLELLRKMNPAYENEDPANLPKMCAIVFVERRSVANVLYHFLKEISQVDPYLDFVKPLFTMGQAAGKSNLIKEGSILNKKQVEIMNDFRNGVCNLIVATSVLEEGIDVPACNLIVCFDLSKTYCDYVQAKGRARAKKAYYVLMVSDEESESYIDELLQYHSIEQSLMNHEQDGENDWLDEVCSHLIPPYTPYGVNGPRITMQSSISLINRYCSQLSTDIGDQLAPKWDIKTLDRTEVPRDWLLKIEKAIEKLPKPKAHEDGIGFYQCSMLLPLNSPLRDEVIGQVMPSKRLAKRSVAVKACRLLHEMQEFDDEHLLPKQVDYSLFEDDDDDGDNFIQVPTKSDKIPRHYTEHFQNCRPTAGHVSFLYAINFELSESCNDDTMFFMPQLADTQFGIVSSKPIPDLCSFPIITRSGKVEVHLRGCDAVVLERDELSRLETFHEFLFKEVIYLFKDSRLGIDIDKSLVQCLIVPLKANSKTVDFDFVDKMICAQKIDWHVKPTYAYYHFNRSRLKDAVVVPWYQPLGKLMAYYVDSVTSLTPSSPFPGAEKKTYEWYYLNKYNLKITNREQRLVEVSLDLNGKNFLISRTEKTKAKKTTHFVPELCYIHPLPASVWKQAVWIPSVLQRFYQMLVAEEVRVSIHESVFPKIGVEHLPFGERWDSLCVRFHQSKPVDDEEKMEVCPVPEAPSAEESSTLEQSIQEIVESLDFEELMWNLDYSFYSDRSSSPSSDESRTSPSNERCVAPERREWADFHRIQPEAEWTDQTMNMSFDRLKELKRFGPSPGQILEALTLTRTGEGFDMERFEAIGDSILKLITSIYVYGKHEKFDEGTLTYLRMRQINNKNLARLGTQKKLPSMLSTRQLDYKKNFLPPGFLPPTGDDAEENPYTDQKLVMKNIADSVEALIGVYLITNGIEGALRIMEWFGLKTLPEARQCNALNGFPILESVHQAVESPEQRAQMVRHLFAGLEAFERFIGYTFNNKELLIEAFTHPSHIGNRLTRCYQKLEFLGDSVLDYLVTRFYYENPRQFSPGVLTDLRSAMVNNETFAVMAVRTGFHRYLKHESHHLSVALDRFVRTQEGNGHGVLHNYFDFEDVDGELMASNLEVPKVLGDIFESVAGAVFIDSGMSLDAVWRTYLPFMRQELENFSVSTPLSPVREVYEKFPRKIEFGKPVKHKDGRWSIVATVDKNRVFKGVGFNSKLAKCAASKYALSVLSGKSPSTQ